MADCIFFESRLALPIGSLNIWSFIHRVIELSMKINSFFCYPKIISFLRKLFALKCDTAAMFYSVSVFLFFFGPDCTLTSLLIFNANFYKKIIFFTTKATVRMGKLNWFIHRTYFYKSPWLPKNLPKSMEYKSFYLL